MSTLPEFADAKRAKIDDMYPADAANYSNFAVVDLIAVDVIMDAGVDSLVVDAIGWTLLRVPTWVL